jgi:hypothetical protein
MNYARNAKFFRPSPSLKLPVIGGLIGLIALIANPVAGIIILAVTGLITFALFSGRPGEAEIDAQAGEFIKNIKAEALRKLTLEEEQLVADSIIFWSYDLGKPILTDPNIGGLQDKRGKDKRWRSPHVVVTVFFFTESAINHYSKYVSLVSDATKISTDEFYYKHVSGVSSDMDEYKDPQTNGSRQYNVVVLKSGGERFRYQAPDNETAENTERALKSLLRQKNA